MKTQLEDRVRSVGDRRASLLTAIFDEPVGLSWSRRHSDLADEVVRNVVESVLEANPNLPPLSIVAVGGYGRRELAPFSDVDLTLIPGDDASPELDAAVKELYRLLHTAFGTWVKLDVSYSYHLINDAPSLDGKTLTSMLDARLVAGSPTPFKLFDQALRADFAVGDFLIDKISERQRAYQKFHDTPYFVQPNLKEGAGGLRCFQCANWIREAIGVQPLAPTPAYEQVARMRNLLHASAGRPADRLTYPQQAAIADRLVIDPKAMMSGLLESMDANYHALTFALRDLREARYRVSRGVMVLRGEARIDGNATASDAAYGIALATQLGLTVEDVESPGSREVDGPTVLNAIATGESTLRNMDRCGLLGELLPELTACRTLMPDDPTHEFTVYEHSLRVVRNLDALQPGTFLGDLVTSISHKGALYLAALLHDAGKLRKGRPHSETGEEIVREVADRWRLASNQTELIAWLVREHLTLARFIRMRDVMQASTAIDCAKVVRDRERLDLLALLTFADVSAVSSTAWTPAQESFLQALHRATSAVLESEEPPATDTTTHRRRLRKELRATEYDESEIARFVDSLPAEYVLSTPPDLVKLHLTYAKKALQGKPTVEFVHSPALHLTDITVCATDREGLLSRLLGVLYAWDVTVHGLRIGTTRDEKPVILDVFSASFGNQALPQATCQQLDRDLRGAISGELDVDELLRARGLDPTRKQERFTYTYIEGLPGILEVQAPGGRGMPFRMANLISSMGWNILAARFAQWAGRGAAAFYLAGKGDRPLASKEVERALDKGIVRDAV